MPGRQERSGVLFERSKAFSFFFLPYGNVTPDRAFTGETSRKNWISVIVLKTNSAACLDFEKPHIVKSAIWRAFQSVNGWNAAPAFDFE
jgi:hypothetical protein